jgi:hypothetical protein
MGLEVRRMSLQEMCSELLSPAQIFSVNRLFFRAPLDIICHIRKLFRKGKPFETATVGLFCRLIVA